MKVILIGNGGREHVLADLASRSPLVDEILVFGGNAGILAEPKVRRIADLPKDVGALCEAACQVAREEKVDLTIVGPEVPLAAGIAGRFKASGLSIFGPLKTAARLEASKLFAKEIMNAAGVPTANYRVFRKGQELELGGYLASLQGSDQYPVVVKADGLCAGKGAIICHTLTEALEAVNRCWIDEEFGDAGKTLLVEQFLRGYPGLLRPELSVMALVDILGNFILLPAAQDYKPVGDGDSGENTGGMGAICPVPWVSQAMMERIGRTIFAPVITEMKRRGTPFSGVLYAGLMWMANGPVVIEFNVRFGDPESEAVLPLLKSDLIPVLKTIADGGSVADVRLQWLPGCVVCVVLASNGYPGKYQVGLPISGLAKDNITQLARPFVSSGMPNPWKVFHAGTCLSEQGVVMTNGGRALCVTKQGVNLADTAEMIQREIGYLTWGDTKETRRYCRSDIGLGVPEMLPKL